MPKKQNAEPTRGYVGALLGHRARRALGSLQGEKALGLTQKLIVIESTKASYIPNPYTTCLGLPADPPGTALGRFSAVRHGSPVESTGKGSKAGHTFHVRLPDG